jgi:hypothetical protein
MLLTLETEETTTLDRRDRSNYLGRLPHHVLLLVCNITLSAFRVTEDIVEIIPQIRGSFVLALLLWAVVGLFCRC